jgi:hypothetical protein
MHNDQYKELEERVNAGTATLLEEFVYEQEKRIRESAPNALMTQKPSVFNRLGRTFKPVSDSR